MNDAATVSNDREQIARALERLRFILNSYARRDDEIAPALEVDPSTRLAHICRSFGLSAFERDVLLLAAAPELDGTFPELIARCAGTSTQALPTLSLALATLPEAAWTALLPNAPLRYWRLIGGESSSSVSAPLQTDEQVTQFLLGHQCDDFRLRALIENADESASLSSAQEVLANTLALTLQRDDRAKVQLICTDRRLGLGIARRASQLCNVDAVVLRVASLPALPTEIHDMVRLCERSSLLSRKLAIFACEDATEETCRQVRFVASRYGLPAIFLTESRIDMTAAVTAFEAPRATRDEQAAHWNASLDSREAPKLARRLSMQFDLRLDTIASVAAGVSAATDEDALWQLVRVQTRPDVETCLERIEANATWPDLILPADRRRLMRQIVNHVRHRDVVFGDWGFGGTSKSHGLTVLFVGPSGTGKSLAARVIANSLRLDLYRVDLSTLFSKYIGETEKNLRRIFDSAERGGSVLVFDEADAVFGKRSEVKDSHDRHANVEVSYLLQRLETFSGVAILTSNMRSAFDEAFMRRFAFVVEFPFPDAQMRKRIWRRAFPPAAPTEGLDFDLLSRLNVPGGNISNIALNAAIGAAAQHSAVGMHHVAAAVRLEFSKLHRSAHDPDLTRWLESLPAVRTTRSA